MGNPKSPNFSIGETASDLDLGGKRNAVREIDSAMEKDAKKTREVSEFTDIAGLLSFYKNKMIFEREDFDPKALYFTRTRKHKHKDDNRIKEMEEHPYDLEVVLKYISQVRNSSKSKSFALVEVVKAVTTKVCYALVYLTLYPSNCLLSLDWPWL